MRDRKRQRHRQREKQAPCGEPVVGLDPRTPGSCPEPKADAQPLSHPGAPTPSFSICWLLYLLLNDLQVTSHVLQVPCRCGCGSVLSHPFHLSIYWFISSVNTTLISYSMDDYYFSLLSFPLVGKDCASLSHSRRAWTCVHRMLTTCATSGWKL